MNERLEDAKMDLYVADNLVDQARNPFMKALIKVIPAIGSFLDAAIDYKVSTFQEDKRNRLVDIIMSDKEKITTEMVSDVEFIISFAKIINAVDRLATNDKVEYFAFLLKNSFFTEDNRDISSFDEYMYTIGAISYRQIQLMIDLKNCPNKEDKEGFRDWVDNTIEKYNCNLDELNNEYLRLQGFGLCENRLEMGEFGNPDYREFHYYITPFFDKLSNFIQAKS
jgi:hypothetical protein